MHTIVRPMSDQNPKLTIVKFNKANLLEGKHILIVESLESRRAIALDRSVFSIGRHPQSSLVLADNMVSRHHATIAWLQYDKKSEPSDYSYWIIDGKGKRKRSLNGIVVNNRKTFQHRLRSGDVIEIGQDTKITYNYIPYTSETEDFLDYCNTPKYQSKNQKLDYKTTMVFPTSDEVTDDPTVRK